MPIKPSSYYCALTTVLLMSTTVAVQAASASATTSPYRLSIESDQMPQPAIPSSNAQSSYPQTYQLVYKYRTMSKLFKSIKAELPEATTNDKLSSNTPAGMPTGQIASDKPSPNSTEEKLAHQPFSTEISLAARAAALDPALVHAVIYVESRYHDRAISPKGAVGLMQVLPDTAARYGINNSGNSPKANLKAGTLYLRDLMLMFDNRVDLVLAAYNAGEGAVVKYSRKIPPYRETRQYVVAVMAKYNEWRNVEAAAVANNNTVDVGLPQPAKPAKSPQTEYLTGTRLTLPDDAFSPNY